MKLLQYLMTPPVALALAFLIVGAPAAPVGQALPSSGLAYASVDCGRDYDDPWGRVPYGSPSQDCDPYDLLAPLVIIASLIAIVAGTLSIIDNCRTDGKACHDFAEWLNEKYGDVQEWARENASQREADIDEWCKASPIFCDNWVPQVP